MSNEQNFVAKMQWLMKILKIVATIVLFPVFVVFFVIFLSVWFVLTITGIGPFLQYLCNIFDRSTLDRHKMVKDDATKSKRVVQIPANLHSCSKDPYNVFVIYMEPKEPSPYPPICIPNGLGATAVLIAPMQEALVKHGFRVLSFDRLGVGLSDINKVKRFPSAMDVVNEMDYVMEAVLPGEKWLLLGPSMGSIVAQCYIAHHAEKVLGMLNMDGLPYPFLKMRSSFVWAAFIYRVYASIIWTGILRPFIGAALKSNAWMFASDSFPISVAIAQMNQANFFGNVALEMLTMMDCCEMADAAWGSLSVLRLPADHLDHLVRARPNISIDFVTPEEKDASSSSSSSSTTTSASVTITVKGKDKKTEIRQATTLRSPSERGSDWATDSEVEQTLVFLRSHLSSPMSTASSAASVSHTVTTPDLLTPSSAVTHHPDTHNVTTELNEPLLTMSDVQFPSRSVLGETWSHLIVRVMSGRNHDFGNAIANSFYSQEMRDLAAAEHAQHVLLAGNGYRTAYPRVSHNIMFSKTDDIVRYMHEIAEAVLSNRSAVATTVTAEH